jgi:chromate transporter
MGVNMATYTGFTTAGIPGSLIAVIGLVTPSIIIIILVSNILDKFKTNKYVQYAMYGLRAASVALITVACLRVAQLAFLRMDLYEQTKAFADLFNPLAIGFGVVLFIVFKITKKHPIFYIVAAAVIGIVLAM